MPSLGGLVAGGILPYTHKHTHTYIYIYIYVHMYIYVYIYISLSFVVYTSPTSYGILRGPLQLPACCDEGECELLQTCYVI